MKKLFFALAAVLAMTACTTTQKTEKLDGEWDIVSVKGLAVNKDSVETAPFFGINTTNMTIYGSLGCNDLTGTLGLDEKAQTIDFSNTGSTRMMCANMSTEDNILSAMQEIKSYKQDGGKLLLLNAGGDTMMELQKRNILK